MSDAAKPRTDIATALQRVMGARDDIANPSRWAERAGLPRQTVADAVKGANSTIETLHQLAEAAGMTLAEMLGHGDAAPPARMPVTLDEPAPTSSLAAPVDGSRADGAFQEAGRRHWLRFLPEAGTRLQRKAEAIEEICGQIAVLRRRLDQKEAEALHAARVFWSEDEIAAAQDASATEMTPAP